MTSSSRVIRGAWFAVVGLSASAVICYFASESIGALCYLLVVGGTQFVVVALATFALWTFKIVKPSSSAHKALIPIVSFNLWLIFFGLAGDYVWEKVADGRLYINYDPLVEWIPFVIPGDWTIDPVCHGALTPGTSWWQMHLVWFIIALPVWALTVFASRLRRFRF